MLFIKIVKRKSFTKVAEVVEVLEAEVGEVEVVEVDSTEVIEISMIRVVGLVERMDILAVTAQTIKPTAARHDWQCSMRGQTLTMLVTTH